MVNHLSVGMNTFLKNAFSPNVDLGWRDLPLLGRTHLYLGTYGLLFALAALAGWLLWLRDSPTLLKRLKGDRQESRVWGFVLRGSMRYPAIAAVLSAGVLVLLAWPAFS